MPLQRLDLISGRSEGEIRTLLDAVHRAVVAAFRVPSSDRYQVVSQHPPGEIIAEDTGLGIPRTSKLVILSITSRPRDTAAKIELYRRVCEELERSCRIAPTDVIVNISNNGDDDWSFGLGRAQFVTGEL